MTNIIYISGGTKKIPVIITKSIDPDYIDIDTAIHVECKDAGFKQERDLSDLGKLIELLPELIYEKRAKRKKRVINLRISQEEKTKIEALAKENGYKNISCFIRDKILQ